MSAQSATLADLGLGDGDASEERDQERDQQPHAQQQGSASQARPRHGTAVHRVTGWMSQPRSAVANISTPSVTRNR